MRFEGAGRTILVVDDERDVREALQLSLEMEGYAVISACHGREALDLLDRGPLPSLILLDLMMPVMNGRDFLAALRTWGKCAQIPVVVVSAFGRMAAELAAQGLETQGFVQKPVPLESLLGAIRVGLQRRGAGHEMESRAG